MELNNTVVTLIIIIIVVIFVFYLIYSQNSTKRNISDKLVEMNSSLRPGEKCENCKRPEKVIEKMEQPNVTSITIDTNNDPYSDFIKKQDLYAMKDPLTYPQMRLPREVLEKYKEYFEKNGVYPPFNEATQPLFDNSMLNGFLAKLDNENEPFNDNFPNAVPLFRLKSPTNTNRFYYYIIDQKNNSNIMLKIPLDAVKINGTRYNNAETYGIPELYDGDIIENISVYPRTKFKTVVYKTGHFP
jgi:hypothetical protein